MMIIEIDANHIHVTHKDKHYEFVVETPQAESSTIWVRHKDAPRGLMTTSFPMLIWNDTRAKMMELLINELNDEKETDPNIN